MKRIFNVLALCALVISAASCSKSRVEQMAMADNVRVECTPEVLALVGDQIKADITVTYPAKYFHQKAYLKVTPVLVYDGGEEVTKTFVYQGEKVKDNYTVVAYNGGSVKQSVSFPYVKGVEKSHLELRSVIEYNGASYEVPAIKVADGCNVTQLFAGTPSEYSFKKDDYQAVLHESAEGQVLYQVNSANVRNSELRSQSVKDLQAALEEVSNDPRYTVTDTRVVAYASPEGGQEHNAKLSDKRAASAQKAWDKVTGGLKTNNLEIQSVGQDWEGFQEAIQNSNIEDKELILRVLSMYSDPAVRESEIKNMSQVYTEINKNVFPELRRARFIADLEYKNFTDAELEELARVAIDALDEESLLRVAANAEKPERKAEIYKIAVQNFGSDRAQFNLAVLAMNENKLDEAVSYLNKVKVQDADVLNAKGVIEYKKGNKAAAVKLFQQSGSPEAKINLGTADILAGDYAAAAAKLADTDSHNKAVAYILSNQLDKAEASIDCKCARSNYLRAIVAARKGNAAEVAKYLEEVAKLNPAMKAKADKDVEFANYR